MKYIERELAIINEALRRPGNLRNQDQLYAAQQALAWALEPDAFRRPYLTAMGTQEGSEDCSGHPHPIAS